MTPDPTIEIDVHLVAQLLQKDELVLLDCREQQEHDLARIEGAVLLPMSCWGEHAEELAKIRGKRVVVCCHHGSRSLRVTHWLRENGFPDAQNMTGGIDAWSEHVDPSVPRY